MKAERHPGITPSCTEHCTVLSDTCRTLNRWSCTEQPAPTRTNHHTDFWVPELFTEIVALRTGLAFIAFDRTHGYDASSHDEKSSTVILSFFQEKKNVGSGTV